MPNGVILLHFLVLSTSISVGWLRCCWCSRCISMLICERMRRHINIYWFDCMFFFLHWKRKEKRRQRRKQAETFPRRARSEQNRRAKTQRTLVTRCDIPACVIDWVFFLFEASVWWCCRWWYVGWLIGPIEVGETFFLSCERNEATRQELYSNRHNEEHTSLSFWKN